MVESILGVLRRAFHFSSRGRCPVRSMCSITAIRGNDLLLVSGPRRDNAGGGG